MKTYEDYCKEYEKIVTEGKAKGNNMAVRLDYYIAIHFLEDNGITEPWADGAAEKLHNALERCVPADKHRFMFVINNMLKTFIGGENT
jgi:hypothetical protein